MVFVARQRGGYREPDGSQWAQGYFLLLASGRSDEIDDARSGRGDGKLEAVYACVRYVRMGQLGHWMMGAARIAGERIGVSGAYGHDGLTLDLDSLSEAVRARFTRLTDEETRAFWLPEHQGHNGAGSELSAMQAIGRRLYREHIGRKG